LRLTIDDGLVTRVTGDPDDTFSGGYVCPKGATFGALARDPDRLSSPRLRDGDGWRDVSFDEAFAEIERRLAPIVAEHGPDSVAVYLGNPNVHTAAGQLYNRPFLKALRTRNIFSASTVDQMPKHVSSGLLFGSPGAIPVPDIDRTTHLLVLGANPRMSNGSLLTAPDLPGRLDALRARGGTLTVVDPRRSRTAAEADRWVAVRPGTDAFLLAAIATTLADEGLVRLGAHLEDHVDGLDAVLGALAPLTADAVAARCRVPAEDIRAIARELAAAERPAVYSRIGVHTGPFGTLNAWLTDVLNVLIGALDAEGGAMWSHPAHEVGRPPRPYRTGRWTSRVRGLPECNGELPVATLADEIETPGEGQVRALVVIAGNPLRSTPNPGRLEAAIRGLELVVSVDPYVTATSRHADVLLPPPGPLHEDHPELAFAQLSVRNVAHYSPAVLPLPPGALQEWQILLRLAAVAAGQGADADLAAADRVVAAAVAKLVTADPTSRLHGLTPDEALDLVAPHEGPARLVDLQWRAGAYGAGTGSDGLSVDAVVASPAHMVDLGPLSPRLPEILSTGSGRIELDSPTLLGDVPRLLAALEDPDDGGLLLVGRRHLRTNNSWGQNVPALVRGRDLCTVWVHPDDAAALGLVDGGGAKVSSRVGTVLAPVEVTDDITPGTVSLPHGFGNGEDGIELSVAGGVGGVNSNVLTDEEPVDPLSGNAVLNGIPVTLTPA
jgi:anaerobic selenocysteine-containing dehydrogenase